MSKVIRLGKINVKPLEADIRWSIEPYLKSCPFRTGCVVAYDLHLTVFHATAPIVGIKPDANKVYSGKIAGVEQWYNPVAKIRNIVLRIDSPELQQRFQQIQQADNKSVYEVFSPHISLAYDIPQNAHRYRWWFNDLANQFNKLGRYFGNTIRFSNEHFEDAVIYSPDFTTAPTKPISELVVRPEEKDTW